MLHHFLGKGIEDLFTPIPGGRKSIAVNQPIGGGSAYPFTKTSDLSQLFADIYLFSVGNVCSYTFPLRIQWIFGFGNELGYFPDPPTVSNPREMTIVDANGTVVFNTGTASSYMSQEWGDDYLVHEWKSSSPFKILRVVQHLVKNEDDPITNYPSYYTPEFAELDPRVAVFAKDMVRTLRDETSENKSGRIRIKAGHNIKLTVEEADSTALRPQTTIVVDCVPGAGAGRYDPGCKESPMFKTINGIRADSSGNINVDAGDCHRVERPIVDYTDGDDTLSVLNHTIQVFNDCQACCSCENFINSYEAIRNIRDKYADLIERIHAVRDNYISNLERWNQQRRCRMAQTLQVAVAPECSDTVTIAAGVCNRTEDCIKNLVIVFSFQYTDAAGDNDEFTGLPIAANTVYSGIETATPSIVCGSSNRSGNFEPNTRRGFSTNIPSFYQMGGTFPYFYAVWDRVMPGSLAAVYFDVEFPDSEPSDSVEVVIDAYAVPDDVPLDLNTEGPPIPGYTFGSGPTTEEAKSYRIAQPVKVVSGLLQSDCC